MRLYRVQIENFKSLRNIDIRLSDFNVVIGPNASGKTNFIDAFLFLREVYSNYLGMPSIPPYIKWWGWKNVVWQGKMDLPIRFVLYFYDDIIDCEYVFETVFTYEAEAFRIYSESLRVLRRDGEEILTFFREGNAFRLFFNKDYISRVKRELEKVLNEIKGSSIEPRLARRVSIIKDIEEYYQNLKVLEDKGLEFIARAKSIFDFRFMHVLSFRLGNLVLMRISYEHEREVLLPSLKIDLFVKNKEKLEKIRKIYDGYVPESLPTYVLSMIEQFFDNITVLKPMDIRGVREPKLPREEDVLSEDYSNLVLVLYNMYIREGKLPERISQLMERLFPNTYIGFRALKDGRITLIVREDDVELDLPSVSDGFLKTLGIATVLSNKKGGMLIIDQIEDSLHAFTIETLIDELRNMDDVTVIITTHSPSVIDLVDPGELIICDKIGHETHLKRVENPEKIREELRKMGITLSERWLYGGL